MSSQIFQRLRVQHLVNAELDSKLSSDWKKTYYILANRLIWYRSPVFNEFTQAVIEDTTAIQVLLRAKLHPPLDFSYALIKACTYGCTEAVQLLLLDTRVDPTYEQSTALYEACKRGAIDIVKLLLQDGRSDPSSENCSALRIATERYHFDAADLIRDAIDRRTGS